MSDFQISHLDHVAIRVVDLERSADWYSQVLGLERCDIPEWGEYPIFLLSGQTGIALFPAPEGEDRNRGRKTIKIDHFAFNVSNEDFNKARDHYDHLGLSYRFSDHIHFHSIYTEDPDGHTVELTTLISPKEEFYSRTV